MGSEHQPHRGLGSSTGETRGKQDQAGHRPIHTENTPGRAVEDDQGLLHLQRTGDQIHRRPLQG